MTIDRQNLLLAIPALAIVAVIAGLVLHWNAAPPPAPTIAPTAIVEPDYFMRDAVIARYQADSELEYRLRAARLEHYPDDTARLTDVEVRRMPGPWTLRAGRGELPPGFDELILHDAVQIETRLDDGSRARLHTEELHVDIAGRIMRAPVPVRVESDHTTAHAERMRARLDQRDLQLDGEVRVEHRP